MSETPSAPPTYTPPPGGGSYTPPPPPPPPPAGGGTAPGGDRTLMIVLAYLGILCLIPLLTKKDDPEVQWHAKNGLAFAIADVVVCIALGIIGAVASRIVFAGCGMSIVWCLVSLGILAVHVIAIVKGVNGQRFRLPVISDFADKM